MSTFDTAGDPAADGAPIDGLDSESVSDAGRSGDAADDAGEDLQDDGGDADIVDGALSPGSTATDSPTTMGDAPSR